MRPCAEWESMQAAERTDTVVVGSQEGRDCATLSIQGPFELPVATRRLPAHWRNKMQKVRIISVAAILTVAMAVSANANDGYADKYNDLLDILSQQQITPSEATYALNLVCSADIDLNKMWIDDGALDDIKNNIDDLASALGHAASSTKNTYYDAHKTVFEDAGIPEAHDEQWGRVVRTAHRALVYEGGVEKYLNHIYESATETHNTLSVIICRDIPDDKAASNVGQRTMLRWLNGGKRFLGGLVKIGQGVDVVERILNLITGTDSLRYAIAEILCPPLSPA